MTRRAARVVASLRDQALDVRLGIRTAAEWVALVDAAEACGVALPDELVRLRDHWREPAPRHHCGTVMRATLTEDCDDTTPEAHPWYCPRCRTVNV